MRIILDETGIEAGHRMAHALVPVSGEVVGHTYMWLNRNDCGRRLYSLVTLFDGSDVVFVLLPENVPRTGIGCDYTVTVEMEYLCLCGILSEAYRCSRDATLFIKGYP